MSLTEIEDILIKNIKKNTIGALEPDRLVAQELLELAGVLLSCQHPAEVKISVIFFDLKRGLQRKRTASSKDGGYNKALGPKIRPRFSSRAPKRVA